MIMLALAVNGCERIPSSAIEPKPDLDPVANDSLRLLCLGDSYTIGESVEISQRWPMQLAAQLGAEGLNLFTPEIIARTGWTTAELQQAMKNYSFASPYDLVTLLIGVNNQFRRLDIAIYQREFTELLQRAIELAGADRNRVIVLSIPDYGVTPFAEIYGQGRISREIDQYNAMNLKISQDFGVHYVDITPISRQALLDLSLLARDQLHPSGKMYAEWVKLVLPVALDILTK